MSDARAQSTPYAIEPLEPRRLLTATALDLNFGVQGRVVSDFSTNGYNSYDILADALLQTDGKLLGLVSSDSQTRFSYPFLVRYNTDGTRDQSFAPGGQLALPFRDGRTYYNRMQVLPDGKLLLEGSSYTPDLSSGGAFSWMRLLFVRLNSDLSLDSSFGSGGVATSDFTIQYFHRFSFEMLPDGKILVGGQLGNYGTDAAIWRFNSDATLDTSFGANGVVHYNYGGGWGMIDSLLVNPDGSFFGLTPRGEAKFNANGTVDTAFGDQGYLPQGLTLKRVMNDGKLLGFETIYRSMSPTRVWSDVLVSRWNSDGTSDATFGNNGFRQIDFGDTDFPYAMNVDSDGRLLVGAGTYEGDLRFNPDPPQHLALARLLPDGQLDLSFGTGGTYIDPYWTAPLALFPTRDNKILAAGHGFDKSNETPAVSFNQDLNITLTRYAPDVPINFSFQSTGAVNEGEPFIVNASGSSYDNGQIVRYEWDNDNDYDRWNFSTEAEGLTAAFRAADDPMTAVALRVTTSDGLRAVAVTGVPTINVPPVANAGPNRLVLIGASVQLPLRADDVVPESGTFTVDYGDGTPRGVFPFSPAVNPLTTTATHTYLKKGIFTLTLTADDGDGGVSTDTAIIRVGDILANVFQDPGGEAYQPAFVPFPDRMVFVDTNNNGSRDASEPSGVTDANGDALIAGLAPGTYRVRVQSPEWQVSTPDAVLNAGYCTVQIGAFAGSTCSFGLTQKAMITGTVFNDVNGNGIRDAGEGGVSGVRFQRDSYTSVLTGNDGFYRLRGLSAGAFQMYMTKPTGWIQTFPFGLVDQIVTNALGQTVDHVDYGLRHIAGATARFVVFIDSNGDGIFGPGESSYTPQDWWYQNPVWLDANNDGVWDHNEERVSISTTSGYWTIPDLPAGTYTFRMLPRPLFVPTVPAENVGVTVTLADGQTSPLLYFGLQKLDTTPPQLLNIIFRYDLKPNQIQMFFNEPLEATTSPLTVMLNGKEVAWDGFWWDYGVYDKQRFLPRGGFVPDGEYQVSLIPHVLFDQSDNELPPMPTWSFFSLKGDINRDRQVSIADFMIVASNFGKTDATYSDGDVNLDGEVTIADFIELSANFNKAIPPLPAPLQAAAAIDLDSSSTADSRIIQTAAGVLFPRPLKHHRKPRRFLVPHRQA